MQKFLSRFEEYCKTPGIESGKARSYANAIAYLCDYFGISTIDVKSVSYIKSKENEIKDRDSALYKDLLEFLSRRGQKSYLTKGWIRASLSYLYDFMG